MQLLDLPLLIRGQHLFPPPRQLLLKERDILGLDGIQPDHTVHCGVIQYMRFRFRFAQGVRVLVRILQGVTDHLRDQGRPLQIRG